MLNRSASLAMSTSVLNALPSKLDIKRHSPTHLYFTGIKRFCLPLLGCFCVKSFNALYLMKLACMVVTLHKVESR